MIDVLDIFAFVVFGVLLAVAVIIVVSLGSLPGQIARKRDHPQATAITVAGWLGLATLGVLWPLALICARPSGFIPETVGILWPLRRNWVLSTPPPSSAGVGRAPSSCGYGIGCFVEGPRPRLAAGATNDKGSQTSGRTALLAPEEATLLHDLGEGRLTGPPAGLKQPSF
jgi:hypothetical protein